MQHFKEIAPIYKIENIVINVEHSVKQKKQSMWWICRNSLSIGEKILCSENFSDHIQNGTAFLLAVIIENNKNNIKIYAYSCKDKHWKKNYWQYQIRNLLLGNMQQ